MPGRVFDKQGSQPLLRWILAFALLILWVVVLYSRGLEGGFILDDALVLSNENVTYPELWTHFLEFESLRPLTYLTFNWNYRWGGSEPRSYHVVNLALHIVNASLFWLCLLKLLSGMGLDTRGSFPSSSEIHLAALSGAILFALHPLQSETVNYVYQRSTLLAATFGLCGLWSLLYYSRRWAAIVAAVLFYAFSSLSKETALSWILVYGVLSPISNPQQETPPRQRLHQIWFWWAGAGLLLLLVAFWALTTWSRSGDTTVASGSVYAPVQYLMTQSRVIVAYLVMTILPIGQNIDHDVTLSTGIGLTVFLCGAFLLGLLALSIWMARQGEILGLVGKGLTLFFVFLIPTSSVVPSNDLMFEHRMYLPIIGLAVSVAATARWTTTRVAIVGRLGRLLPVILAVYFSPWTWARNGVWADPVVLWSDAVVKSPRKARPRVMLGSLLLERDTAAALTAFEEALSIEPRNREALNNLGLAYRQLGALERAEASLKQALEVDPEYATAHLNLANLYYSLGNYRDAERYYKKVVELQPHRWQSYFNQGNALWRLSDGVRAEELYRQALRINPRASPVLNNLATVLMGRGETETAEHYLRQAVEVDPAYVEARINLVQVLMTRAKLAEAGLQLELLRQSGAQDSHRRRLNALEVGLRTR